MNDVQNKIADECDRIKMLLIQKNESYGNSALDPIRIFSSADPIEQIKVRIDDKLSRLKRGKEIGEDTITDLIGYLVLLRVAMQNRNPFMGEDLCESMNGSHRCERPKNHGGDHYSGSIGWGETVKMVLR